MSASERIRQLQQLRDEGVLSAEEFEGLRAKALEELGTARFHEPAHSPSPPEPGASVETPEETNPQTFADWMRILWGLPTNFWVFLCAVVLVATVTWVPEDSGAYEAIFMVVVCLALLLGVVKLFKAE